MGRESHILIHDIIDGHEERMDNLKKYYPFFRLCEQPLTQFREGRFDRIDMGYVTMALLRFLIEENSFNDRTVTYEECACFLKNLLRKDFDLREEDGTDELVSYIFDKITNEGRPFTFNYYEPKSRKMKTGRIRLIESQYRDEEIRFNISADGIAFYLDTKEVKDESKISIQQILLEKMIRSRDFKGGAEVIGRINNEVSRLMLRQGEIISLLNRNIFEGMKALEDFSDSGLKWFAEEQKLFDANLVLVQKALARAESDGEPSQAMEEIFFLNQELLRAMDRHEALLSACTKLQVQADEMLIKAKHSRFRKTMDFNDLLLHAMEKDDIRLLEVMGLPLLGLRIRKTFSFDRLDDLLTCRPDGGEAGESLPEGTEENYIFEDVLEDERIRHNHGFLLRVLFDTLLTKKEITLKELHYLYIMKFTENLLKNCDYYTFLVHLSQKDFYDLSEIRKDPDTFLEEVMAELVAEDRKKEYEDLKFSLKFLSEEQVFICEDMYLTNIKFERRGM